MMQFLAVLLIFKCIAPGLHCCDTDSRGNTTASATKVRIGFLVEDLKSRAATDGAMLAVSEASVAGKARGFEFELVTKSMEGPWGTGSKQTVDLVFDDNVIAIVAACKGRNAHLAEQVCAKSKVALVSARASDPTLNQAFVPWYFSVVPGDFGQASLLVDEIIIRKKLDYVIISQDDYDSRQASGAFVGIIKRQSMPSGPLLVFSGEKDYQDISGTIANRGATCAVVFCNSREMPGLLSAIRSRNPLITVYVPLTFFEEDVSKPEQVFTINDLITVLPSAAQGGKAADFGNRFRKLYGYNPSFSAAFAYDAVKLITEAVLKAGADRDSIQDYIAAVSLEGITGTIEFDRLGNRKSNGILVRFDSGKQELFK